ncbi:MAG TPA: gliding motility-associated protein GldE [Cyclobacteriaceae bacterium]|nr:gliding motility-associated protein GldE [Cyclobacteriaceae bacterium]
MDEPPANTLLANLFLGIDLITIVSFIVIIIMLLMSAVIAASEVAFFSLKPIDLQKCREGNDPRDKDIDELLSKPRELLATILIMTNLVNVGIVTLSTFVMWELTGTHNPAEFIIGVVTFSVTFCITFFGEIIPKVYATKNNMVFARALSGLWKYLIIICKPISFLLLAMSRVVERRFKKKGYETTVDELNQALDMATVNDESSEDEKEILKGIVNFGTLTVKQIMRARLDVSAVDYKLNFIALMDHVNKFGFSRIPVYTESLDKIEGVLYIKDLLPYLDQSEKFEWQKLLRPGFFVPESKKIDSLLKDFQAKRIHMAIVVDEYGGTSGLITLEDIIEEIIGDINDEFDDVGIPFQKVDEHTYIFEGKTSLHDICKVLDLESNIFDDVKGDSESLGGLILELNNEFPNVNDEITFEQFTFTIEGVDRKRIKKIKVHIHEQENS